METESRVAVIGIVVDQTGDTEELNKVLHQYGQYILYADQLVGVVHGLHGWGLRGGRADRIKRAV